jgi:hypothetical protein
MRLVRFVTEAMYVCMYVLCICVYNVCMYAHMHHVYNNESECVCVRACMYVHTYTYIHTHISVGWLQVL